MLTTLVMTLSLSAAQPVDQHRAPIRFEPKHTSRAPIRFEPADTARAPIRFEI